MRISSFLIISLSIALLCCTACRRPDAVETRSDVQRYVKTAPKDFQLLLERVNYFVAEEVNRGGSLPPDLDRFLDWRKKEWWNLREELAYHIYYNWDIISKLVEDAARFQGYQIKNFPKGEDEILRFFNSHTQTEWQNLVKDVTIWVEYNQSKRVELFADLRRSYERVHWETANLVTDWHMFLQWRKNVYALQADYHDFFDHEINLVDDFKADVNRFQVLAMVNSGNIVVDFKGFLSTTTDYEIPRLNDDVSRYLRRAPSEYRLAEARAKLFVEENMKDFDKLYRDIGAYKQEQLNDVKIALAQANRFFEFYEREYEPLSEDVKRYWRSNILAGESLVDELRDFYQQEKIAGYELKAGAKRFVHYGGVEWGRLKEGWKRFVSGDGVSYGSEDVPSAGDFGGGNVYGDLKLHEIDDNVGR